MNGFVEIMLINKLVDNLQIVQIVATKINLNLEISEFEHSR